MAGGQASAVVVVAAAVDLGAINGTGLCAQQARDGIVCGIQINGNNQATSIVPEYSASNAGWPELLAGP